MPVSPVTFRSVCGHFNWLFMAFMFKRVLSTRKATAAYRMQCVRATVGRVVNIQFILIVCYLLIQSGDVETNPGPPKPAVNTRQSTLNMNSLRSQSESVSEPSMSDVMGTLCEMKSDINIKLDTVKSDINAKLDTVNTNMKQLQSTIKSLNEEVEDLKEENRELKDRLAKTESEVVGLESKLEDLENRSRRNNIIVHGLKPTNEGRETWEQCEQVLTSMFCDKLGIEDEVCVDRAHRLRPGDPKSPIIARLTFFKDKERVLATARQKLKGTPLYVGEDYTRSVREVRKKLSPFLRKAKEENKRCKMVFDHLVIEGKRFNYDPSTAGIVESKSRPVLGDRSSS